MSAEEWRFQVEREMGAPVMEDVVGEFHPLPCKWCMATGKTTALRKMNEDPLLSINLIDVLGEDALHDISARRLSTP